MADVKVRMAMEGAQVVVDGLGRVDGALGKVGSTSSVVANAANKLAEAIDKQSALLQIQSTTLVANTDAVAANTKAIQAVSETHKAAEAAARAHVGVMEQLKDAATKLGLAWAGMKLLEYAKDMAMLNARYQELGVVQAVVGKNAGYTAQEMEAAAVGMQKAGITMIESRNTTVQLAQAQISLADATKLARIAQDAAVIGNMNSSEALNHMIYGIKSGQIDVLRTIGINVNFEQSYKALAAQLGVTTEQLTEHQKMQARENAVLEEGTKITGAYEAAMGTAGKQMRSMARYAEDLKVIRGEVFNETLTVAVMAFVDQMKEGNQAATDLANNGALRQWGSDVADLFALIADSGVSVVSVIKMVGATAGYVAAHMAVDMNGSAEQIAAASNAIDEAYKENISSAMGMSSMFRDALEKRRQAAKDDANQRVAIEADYAKRAIAVQLAYAGQSLEIQQAAQRALAENMFPGGVPTAPKDVPNIASTKHAAASAYDTLSEAMAREQAMADAELKYGTKLSGADKFRTQTLEKLKEAYADGKISLEEWSRLYDRMIVAAERLAAVDDVRAAEKAQEELNKTMEAYAKAERDSVIEAEKRVIAAQREFEAHGLLKSQVEAVTLAYLEQSRESAALAGEDVSNIEKRIEAQKKLIGILSAGEVRDANDKAAKEVNQAWTQIASQAGQSLSDEIMRGGKNVGRLLQDFFKTLVFRVPIEAFVKTGVGAIASMLGFAGPASAATGGGPGGSMFGSTAGQWLTDFGGSLAMQADKFGAWLVNNTSGGLNSFGSSLMQNANKIGDFGQAVGDAVGYLSALKAATQGKWGQAAGTAIGTYFGGPIGAAIGSKIGSWVDKKFGGETRSGADYTLTAGGQVTQGYTVSGGALADAEVRAAISQTFSGINARLVAMGSAATLSAFQAGLNTSGKGRGGVFSGGTLSTGATFGETGVGDAYKGTKFEKTSTQSPDAKTALENFVTDLNQATIQALQAATDIPKSISDKLAGVDAEALSNDAAAKLINEIDLIITQVSGFQEAVSTLPFEQLKNLSFDAAKSLGDLAGGFDKLGANLATYYDKFFSEGEKNAALTERIGKTFAELGLQMPALDQNARAAFRALVEGQDLSTEAGRKAYAALLGVAGAFDQVAPAAQAAANASEAAAQQQAAAAEAMAKRVADALGSLGDTRFGLENDLLGLKGMDSEVARRVRERDLARLTEGMGAEDAARITAAYDYNITLQKQVDAQKAATAAAQEAAAAQARAAQEAAAAQAQAAQEAAAAQAQAADAATKAAEQARSAWQSVADTIYGEVARIRGLMGGTNAASLAQAQAQFAIATAQARAGDQDAAKKLPALSQALLALAEANASTLTELRIMQGQVAGSLDQTGNTLAGRFALKVPSFDVGTDYVPNDMLALVHQGEKITPAAYNRGDSTNAELVAEVRALRQEVAQLRAASAETARNTKKTADTLVRVTRDGESMVTVAA